MPTYLLDAQLKQHICEELQGETAYKYSRLLNFALSQSTTDIVKSEMDEELRNYLTTKNYPTIVYDI